MSEYIINGTLCRFPSVPLGELQKYTPTPHTHLLAWARPAEEVHQMTAILMLDSAYLMGALQLPPYLIETNQQRTIYLLEQPNRHIFEEHVTMWLGYYGVAYTFICPYQIAKRQELLEGDAVIKEIDDWLSYKHHPAYFDYKAAQKQSALNMPTEWTNHKR